MKSGNLSATVLAFALAVSSRSPAHSERRAAPIVSAGSTFLCTPIAVWDGDGPVWCNEGPKIRLAGIAAREIDGSCRLGQPCPSASGVAARDQLVALMGGATGAWRDGHVKVAGGTMRCVSTGSGRGDRTAAWCTLPNGRDVSCAMIATGTTLRWASYDREDRCRRRPAW